MLLLQSRKLSSLETVCKKRKQIVKNLSNHSLKVCENRIVCSGVALLPPVRLFSTGGVIVTPTPLVEASASKEGALVKKVYKFKPIVAPVEEVTVLKKKKTNKKHTNKKPKLAPTLAKATISVEGSFAFMMREATVPKKEMICKLDSAATPMNLTTLAAGSSGRVHPGPSRGFFRGGYITNRRSRPQYYSRYKLLYSKREGGVITQPNATKSVWRAYRRIFHFLIFSRCLGIQKNLRRPIYSHLFSERLIVNRYLLQVHNRGTDISYSQILWNNTKSVKIPYEGLVSMFSNVPGRRHGNLANLIDNYVLAAYSSRLNPQGHASVSGAYSNASGGVATAGGGHRTIPSNSFLPNQRYSAAGKLLDSSPSSWPKGLTSQFGLRRPDIFMFSKNWGSNLLLLENQLLFKFIFWSSEYSNINHRFFKHNLLNNSRVTFSFRSSPLMKSNLIPLQMFKYVITRKVLKTVVIRRYLPQTSEYFHRTLVHFIEYHTGKRVYLKFNPFITNSLTYSDIARCFLWEPRVVGWQKLLGHRIFVNESLRILHLAIRFRDPTFLSYWIKEMMYRISFWKVRPLFRYIKFALRLLFWTHFEELGFRGAKIMLRGKISVAGNARTRTLTFTVGHTSHSEMNNRVLSHFTTVDTFTGVMGFRLSFYF